MTRKKVRRTNENDNANSIKINEAKIAMIQMLIPLGIEAIQHELQSEVTALAGERYKHDNSDIQRWGSNKGSAYLGNQKVQIKVPRVRDVVSDTEVPLQSYEALQNPSHIDDSILSLVINGISTRKYERAATLVPETFGIKSNTVSRKFIETSSKKLKELSERDLSSEDIVAIFVDGKTFAENNIVIALGVNMEGEKIILGFEETSTENSKTMRLFIRKLIDRGLNTEHEILFIVDGSKGLRKGIQAMLGKKAIFQRCQWHKRENIVAYLPKEEQVRIRRKLQKAYREKTYRGAKAALSSIRKEVKLMNESAATSLDEGMEDTLTLHKLDLIEELGRSFKTNNCIENINRQLEQYTGRVCYWKNSNQRQRWVAASLLEIEQRLNKVGGKKHLQVLREQMKLLNGKSVKSEKMAA